MFRKLLLLLPVVSIIACNNPRKSTPTAALTDSVAKIAGQPVLDTVWVPGINYDHPYDNNILPPGQFHDNEADTASSYNDWLGLFYKHGACYLAKTVVVLSRVHDEIVDDEDSTA